MQLSAKPILFCISLFVKNMVLAHAAHSRRRAEKIAIFGKFSTVFDPISEGTQTKKNGPRTEIRRQISTGCRCRFYFSGVGSGPPAADLDQRTDGPEHRPSVRGLRAIRF